MSDVHLKHPGVNIILKLKSQAESFFLHQLLSARGNCCLPFSEKVATLMLFSKKYYFKPC